MITQYIPEGYLGLFLVLVGVFVVAFALSKIDSNRRRKQLVQDQLDQIQDASPFELLKIYERLDALEDTAWRVIPRVQLLVEEYETGEVLENLKTSARDGNAYREDLLRVLADVTALSQLVYDLDIDELYTRSNNIFDVHTAYIEEYLKAIKQTRVREELQESSKKGYASLKTSLERVDAAKKQIYLGLRKAVREGMPLEEVKKIVETEKEKVYTPSEE